MVHGFLYLLNKLTKPCDITWSVTSFRETSDGEMIEITTVEVDRYDLTEWLFIDAELPDGVDHMQITSTTDKDNPETLSRWN